MATFCQWFTRERGFLVLTVRESVIELVKAVSVR